MLPNYESSQFIRFNLFLQVLKSIFHFHRDLFFLMHRHSHFLDMLFPLHHHHLHSLSSLNLQHLIDLGIPLHVHKPAHLQVRFQYRIQFLSWFTKELNILNILMPLITFIYHLKSDLIDPLFPMKLNHSLLYHLYQFDLL